MWAAIGGHRGADVFEYAAMLQTGIVGLPNAGKSTLFNAITASGGAEVANYPFSTIEPNIGVVAVPDQRLTTLGGMFDTGKQIPATIEYVDIAGLVPGASKGEGLGNCFLGRIREVDAIVHAIRCFESHHVVHSMGTLDPLRDIEIVSTELILADLQSVESQIERNRKRAKRKDQEAIDNLALLEPLQRHLDGGRPALDLPLKDEEKATLQRFFLLSSKPVLFACNVGEDDLSDIDSHPLVGAVKESLAERPSTEFCVISAQVESDLAELDEEDEREYRAALGAGPSGVGELIRATYQLLGLASFFTRNEEQVRAWNFRRGMTVRECAGIIHTDFAKGFIRAEVVAFDELLQAGSMVAARSAGRCRVEGKEYAVKDGELVLFHFHS